MKDKTILHADIARYEGGRGVPAFQKYYRKAQMSKFFPMKLFYIMLLKITRKHNFVELSFHTKNWTWIIFWASILYYN